MFSQGRILFSFFLLSLCGISNVRAECPHLQGTWQCKNGERFKINQEVINGYEILRFFIDKIHFIYTVTDDGSVPSSTIVSKSKVSLTGLGASCLLDREDRPVFRYGLHPESIKEGDNIRLMRDYTISDDGLLLVTNHLSRDVTSFLGDIDASNLPITTCTKKK